MNPLTDAKEIKTGKDKNASQDPFQDSIIDQGDAFHSNKGNKHESNKDRNELTPYQVVPHLHENDQRLHQSQQTGQRRSLSVAGHEVGEYRHDEHPESETRHALHETGSRTEKNKY